jgi:hypothetical protein
VNVRSPWRITLLFIVLLFGVASFIYYPRYEAEQAKTKQLAILLSGTRELVLDPPTKSGDCVSAGALPDHGCTPGAVFPNATVDEICVPGYSQTVRKVGLKLRKAVFEEYGVAYPEPRGSYEVDHLIPLALGGSNEISNLFLEPAAPAPGFKEKDVVEVYLHDEVCAGRVNLALAQGQIARDWLSVYNGLTPDVITRIKAKFRSWAE